MSEVLNEKPHAEELPRSAAAGIVTEGKYVPPPADSDGKIWVRTTALVQAESEDLYRLWRDVETAPRWQEQIARVTAKSPENLTGLWSQEAPLLNGILKCSRTSLVSELHGAPSAETPAMRAK